MYPCLSQQVFVQKCIYILNYFRKCSLSVAGDAALLIFVNKFKTAAFKEARVYLVPRKRASSNPMAGVV